MDYLDYTKLTGSCYRIVMGPTKMGWGASKNLCTVDGATYLVIDDDSERDIVREIAGDLNSTCLLFLDFARVGYWNLFTTSNGESIDEVGYAPGFNEIKWASYQDKWSQCLVLNSTTMKYQISYQWPSYDYQKGFPICEKRIRHNLIPDAVPKL